MFHIILGMNSNHKKIKFFSKEEKCGVRNIQRNLRNPIVFKPNISPNRLAFGIFSVADNTEILLFFSQFVVAFFFCHFSC